MKQGFPDINAPVWEVDLTGMMNDPMSELDPVDRPLTGLYRVILETRRDVSEETADRVNGLLRKFCEETLDPLFDAVKPNPAGRT